MNISHRPILGTDSVCKHYSERDGVAIKYVCTTEKGRNSPLYDIFYRDIPHPKFGNRYFGLHVTGGHVLITNADWVESLDFCMIKASGQWHYSRYTHDFYSVDGYAIDGGRSYERILGNELGMPDYCYMKVKDGEFTAGDY